MDVKFDLQHFCCGPKGCQIEVEQRSKNCRLGADNNTFQDVETYF